MDKNFNVITFILNTFVLRNPGVTNLLKSKYLCFKEAWSNQFGEIIKIAIKLIKLIKLIKKKETKKSIKIEYLSLFLNIVNITKVANFKNAPLEGQEMHIKHIGITTSEVCFNVILQANENESN